MYNILPNQDERKVLLAGKERLQGRDTARDEAKSEADKHEALAAKQIAEANEFDRTGDIHDTAKVAEANAKRTQANLYKQRAAAFRAKAQEEESKVAELVADVGSDVKVIGRRLLDEWVNEAERALAPWFWELGRAQMAARQTDFYVSYLNWTTRHHNGISGVDRRAETILSEIDSLLDHGIPERFGCPYLDLTKPATEAAPATVS